jgi:hypothetical protein
MIVHQTPEELTLDDHESPVPNETSVIVGHVAEEETNLLVSHTNRSSILTIRKRNRCNGPGAAAAAVPRISSASRTEESEKGQLQF